MMLASLKPAPYTLNKTTPATESILSCSEQAARWLSDRSLCLTTVESCTGGGLAQAITEVAGSSGWFDRGFVTYTNLSKHQLVGVDLSLIEQFGAVSEQVAGAMAKGGLDHSQANISLAITGIAGPTGGSAQKPVGTVCFGRAQGDSITTTTQLFNGNRQDIRNQSIVFALSEWMMTTASQA